MFSSVAKIRYFHRSRIALRASIPTSFVATEIEYIAVVARSVFDLVQEAISTLWNRRIRLADAEAERKRKKKPLPDTFSKTVIKTVQLAEVPKTADDLVAQYQIPPTLAEAYTHQTPFFMELRAARDAIAHGLRNKPNIFPVERGFAIDPNAKPFNSFSWEKCHEYNENLVALLPWLSHIVLGTIDASNKLVHAFAAQIEFPQEIAPGYKVYLRSEHNDVVTDLLKARDNTQIWWPDEDPPEAR